MKCLKTGRIGLLVGNQPAVGRPPVAVRPIHLLLRDEFGGAVGDRSAGAAGNLPLGS
jgi:hypothetical protein